MKFPALGPFVALALVAAASAPRAAAQSLLPFDASNPVIYDNDAHTDVYTDELLLAASSAGRLNVRAFITTSPSNKWVGPETYELDARGRDEILNKARRAGMKNLPPHVRNPSQTLVRPTSGVFQETAPLGSAAGRLIVEEARKATPKKPLVLVMGGPLTVAADAWLQDPTIADNVVVVWLGGRTADMNDFNGWVDPWASAIVLQRMRLVQVPSNLAEPQVPNARLAEVPDSEFRQWMIDKHLIHVDLPGGRDADGQPVISVLRPDYVQAVRRVSLGGWTDGDNGPVPVFKDDPRGRGLQVTRANRSLATEVWWATVSNPAAYNGCPARIAAQRPWYAMPYPIDDLINRIDAEDFDRGGEGIAYHDLEEANAGGKTRRTGVDVGDAGDDTGPGGYYAGSSGLYAVTNTRAGEWIEYTVDIKTAGRYSIEARVSSAGKGGSFHLEVGGIKSGKLTVPDTGGWKTWRSLETKTPPLHPGVQIVRLVMDADGPTGFVGNFNYMRFKAQVSARGGKPSS